jgi:transcriptional regulator with PAS, ATPase and Fis domain
MIHDGSALANGPFIEVNCAAISELLVESELFGSNRRGHLTAFKDMKGKVEAAQGGTLFLDEIASCPSQPRPSYCNFSRRAHFIPSAALICTMPMST